MKLNILLTKLTENRQEVVLIRKPILIWKLLSLSKKSLRRLLGPSHPKCANICMNGRAKIPKVFLDSIMNCKAASGLMIFMLQDRNGCVETE